jgi:predicted homoserine dehydrogenase-like protein
MIVVDELLRERARQGNPIRVGLVGAGAAARMIAIQLLTPVEGIRLVVIANRTPAKGARIYADEGVTSPVSVSSAAALDDAIAREMPAITGDATLLCGASSVDVIVDATGSVDFGGQLAMRAFESRKHVVLINTELDSTLGPILKVHADRAGVIVTNTDGDEPGVAMTLLRYLESIGLKPVATGNLKGLVDLYRTPETQRGFAEKYSMNPRIVTSFADGTKLSMEAAVLANATGFKVGKRGMYGKRCDHVNEIVNHLPMEQLLSGGLVDYALGAAPHSGAFVVVHEEHPAKRRNLGYFKMGDGPLYVFYTPYHLPHIQIAATIARAALLGDATVSPLGAPVCSVATFAKKDLKAGDILDGVGGFTTYGVVENTGIFNEENLLSMGLSEGGRIKRDILKDEPITFADVELPEGRFCDALYAEQSHYFSKQPVGSRGNA